MRIERNKGKISKAYDTLIDTILDRATDRSLVVNSDGELVWSSFIFDECYGSLESRFQKHLNISDTSARRLKKVFYSELIEILENDLKNHGFSSFNGQYLEQSVDETNVVQIPKWALYAVLSGDTSDLDDIDLDDIERFLREWKGYEFFCPENESFYFTNDPEFGLPCDVADIYAYKI